MFPTGPDGGLNAVPSTPAPVVKDVAAAQIAKPEKGKPEKGS
ncbi:MAG: hypothetical protein JWP03_1804 [Phycisphaerales bacterium]|nr:hypothetical protein [Phycisphaerales bacterium]